jgi:hypothetical protein
MNEWSYTSTRPVRLHGVVLSKSTGTTLPLRLIKYYYCDQMEEDEVGGACNTHGTDKHIKYFGCKI